MDSVRKKVVLEWVALRIKEAIIKIEKLCACLLGDLVQRTVHLLDTFVRYPWQQSRQERVENDSRMGIGGG
jgi:hypothetical protein